MSIYRDLSIGKIKSLFLRDLPIKTGFFANWRRRRDLNPRYGFPYYSLSRGAP